MATEVTGGACQVTSVLSLSIFVEKGGIVATRLLGFAATERSLIELRHHSLKASTI